MHPGDGTAPAWLFSFVDLAFLLLIALTQIGSRAEAPDLAEIAVPRLQADSTDALPARARERWQLRVYPRGNATERPFELVRTADAISQADGERVAFDELRRRLEEVRAGVADRPLLAPHRDSRSEDMLEAAGMLEELWPGRRRATVNPLLAAS